MMFSCGLCGHFALSTLLETCFKDPVFEINVNKICHQQYKNPTNSNVTPKSKHVSDLDIILSSLTPFDTF